MPVVNRIADLAPSIAEWRRDLHAHPEVLFDTHRTSALVADKLRAFGCDEVVTGIGRTGVVGVIRGRASGSGKVIGLRADMDALPMTEASGLPHASTTPGAMHACGHDGHTAMLLGAAQHLAETRNFDGTAVVIFQPAEEGGGGGREMVEDGHDGALRHPGGLRPAQHAGPARRRLPPSAPARCSPPPTSSPSRSPAAAATPPSRTTPSTRWSPRARSCWRCSRSSPATSTR